MNRCLLNTYRGGSIRIGDNCFFGDNCKVISDIGQISIGKDCLIAEDVVIRAANHGTRKGMPIRLQDNHVKDVTIGNDVWIGRGVTVLPGAVIADGCIIGANSVVRGATDANAERQTGCRPVR
jgi:acetyltransferase-like isoleucine patch superfamily enzyme